MAEAPPQALPAWQASAAAVRRARPLLGTLVEIHAGLASAGAHQRTMALLHAAVDAAFAAVEGVHRRMSCHDPDSELSRLNRAPAGASLPLSEDTYAVLAAALRFAAVSEGAFDPCVAPMLREWGYLPGFGAVTETAAGAWRAIELMPDRRVRFHRPVQLDLGGIAKGYAVDVAVRALQEAGIEEIVVNAGGDLRVAGSRPRPVHVRHPAAPMRVGHVIEIQSGALATSAAYFSRRRMVDRERMLDREVSALVNPRTGVPFLGERSISIRAGDCMSADALTKVVMFAAQPVAERALACCDARAVVLTPADPPLDIQGLTYPTRPCTNIRRGKENFAIL